MRDLGERPCDAAKRLLRYHYRKESSFVPMVESEAVNKALRLLVKAQKTVECGCPSPRPNITYHKPACRYRRAVHSLAEFKVWGNDFTVSTEKWSEGLPGRPCKCDRREGTQCRLHAELTDLLMEGANDDEE